MSQPKPRVMCFDGDWTMLWIIQETLEVCGFEVTATKDPEDVSRAPDENWDLLLVDMKGPGQGGVALCRRLRESGWEGRIILTSSLKPKASERRALDELRLGLLVKPFGPRELLYRVRQSMAE